MEIEKFKKLQAEFEEQYIGPYEKKPEDLLFLAVALAGEVGEFANLVKKYWREEKKSVNVAEDDKRDYFADMEKEIIDVFTYFLIVANVLNIDIEEGYMENLTRNRKRFKKLNS